jgi:hypothetical protein
MEAAKSSEPVQPIKPIQAESKQFVLPVDDDQLINIPQIKKTMTNRTGTDSYSLEDINSGEGPEVTPDIQNTNI